MPEDLWWYGYEHTSGSVIVKRYYTGLDIYFAKKSPNCKKITEAFKSENKETALDDATELLKGEKS